MYAIVARHFVQNISMFSLIHYLLLLRRTKHCSSSFVVVLFSSFFFIFLVILSSYSMPEVYRSLFMLIIVRLFS